MPVNGKHAGDSDWSMPKPRFPSRTPESDSEPQARLVRAATVTAAYCRVALAPTCSMRLSMPLALALRGPGRLPWGKSQPASGLQPGLFQHVR